MLNGIFQHLTWHDTLFNICSTTAATFVDQQMLNRVLPALGQFMFTFSNSHLPYVYYFPLIIDFSALVLREETDSISCKPRGFV